MTITELREKRSNTLNATKAFLNSHRTEKGVLTAEDDATYSAMEQDIADYSREIARLERQQALEDELSRPTSKPLTSQPESHTAILNGRASNEYKLAMLDALRSGFKRVSNVLTEGTDANGGYLVPAEWDSRLIQSLTQENIMRQLATVISTTGEHKINIANTKPATSWIEEGGALEWGDATFGQVILDAHKLHVAIKVTEELLYDNAFNLESYITEQFSKALADAEEDAFLNGDGDGKPTGLFTSATAAATTTALKADDLINLVYALKRPYRKNASFIMNDQTFAAIRALKDNNGAYIWQPSYQAGEPATLLGCAVHTSAYAPTDAIAFGDYSYYNIGDRGTRSFAELKELFAGNGLVGFVAKERVDGKLILPEAVQVLTVANG